MKTLLAISLCFILILPVYATEQSSDESINKLMSLELEELLTISVASKREETIVSAPGIISIITSKDIQNYGANDLRDLLQRLPNTYGINTGLFRDSTTSIRGQSPGALDNHVLILLNGRPVRDDFNGTIAAPVYRNMPLEIIDKIEVIRGPGSVLYGTNAFAGAINIVTKKPSEKMEGSVTGGYGSFNTTSASAAVSQKVEGVDLAFAGKYLNSDGWPFNLTDEAGVYSSKDYTKKNYGYFGQGSYKGLTMTGFSGRDNEIILPGLPVVWSSPNITSDWERNFFDGQYEHDLAYGWKGKFNFTLNNTNGNSQGRLRNFNSFLFEPSISGVLFDKVNTVAGFTYEKQDGSLITENVSYSSDRYSAYLQSDYSPLSFLKLIAGVQVNKQQDLDYNFSPRGGAIFTLNSNTGVKLLYGEAYRSAAAVEQLTTLVSVGNPGLKPEKNATFDAQLFYSTPKLYSALTYYKTHQTDTIVAIPDPLGVRQVNRGTIDYQGIELEAKASITQHLDLTGSISKQFNKDNTGNTDIGRVPEIMVKTGMVYTWEKGYTLGLFNSYFSDAEGLPGSRPVNPLADSYNFLTANASIKLRKATGLDIPDLTLNLYGDNLLNNNSVYFPEVGRGVINTIPIWSGRAFYGSIKFQFK